MYARRPKNLHLHRSTDSRSAIHLYWNLGQVRSCGTYSIRYVHYVPETDFHLRFLSKLLLIFTETNTLTPLRHIIVVQWRGNSVEQIYRPSFVYSTEVTNARWSRLKGLCPMEWGILNVSNLHQMICFILHVITYRSYIYMVIFHFHKQSHEHPSEYNCCISIFKERLLDWKLGSELCVSNSLIFYFKIPYTHVTINHIQYYLLTFSVSI